MNPLLQVKLRFENENSSQKPGDRNLRSKEETSVEKMDSLMESLRAVLRFYRKTPRIVAKLLVDVNYNDIIAKSNRIQALIKPKGLNTNDTIVGARFSNAEEGKENHIITHYVDIKTVENTLSEMQIAKRFLLESLNGKATASNFKEPNSTINYEGYTLSKKKLRDIIIDCSLVNSFSVPYISAVPNRDNFLVTFYKTELSLSSVLEKLSIDDIKYQYSFYGSDTISMTKDLLEYLNEKVPYLISMVSSDLSKITLNEIAGQYVPKQVEIPDPQNEPTIGVIDTLFDDSVYFNKWVKNQDCLDDVEKLCLRNAPKKHGTEVSSIIVDGPRLNPWLDDGCGRFKVRHFGVCEDKISTSRLVKKIKEIINRNLDIHVWNLSLGTEDEVSKNFISFDAAALDEMQFKQNVIFVVSGTNDNREQKKGVLKVGSPADSLNSIVVNSVKRNGQPASYSRKGTVLSFFNKPDVAYYGGDYDDRIIAYSPDVGEEHVYGTSFAAPWISRKLCYLIDVMQLPKEVAKALIIDSAAGWNYKTDTYKFKNLIGYGIVPIDIQKVLSAESEEIKFVVYGSSSSYKTTNYTIPVPKDDEDKFPYVARATLCYFPQCLRLQGVDYTCRELSLKFGRVKKDGKIDDINENIQDEEGSYVNERTSRKEFRKWENTKFISRILGNNRSIKAYGDGYWGFEVTSKERLRNKTKDILNFGAVVTLKEINGINRIEDFIRACTLRGWIVNEMNIQDRIDVYNSTQENVTIE